MRTKIIINLLLLVFLSTYTFAQHIKGYADRIEVGGKKEPKLGNTTKPADSNDANNSVKDSTLVVSDPDNSKSEQDRCILFQETFLNKTFDNTWIANSGTNNMNAYIENGIKKGLKISCKNPDGNSFLEYDLTNKVRGKKLRINAFIKTENIIRGSQSYEIGQLCMKFNVNGIDIYEAVQNLVGDRDWAKYSAHQDGRTSLDNTTDGDYVFKVPENATNVILYLGLQNCTGTIYFKNVKVIEVL